MKIVLKNISSVGQLAKALCKLPAEATLYPMGSCDCKLVYDDKNQIAYIDEDFSFLAEGELEEDN